MYIFFPQIFANHVQVQNRDSKILFTFSFHFFLWYYLKKMSILTTEVIR